jgi:hypothetical protein
VKIVFQLPNIKTQNALNAEETGLLPVINAGAEAYTTKNVRVVMEKVKHLLNALIVVELARYKKNVLNAREKEKYSNR